MSYPEILDEFEGKKVLIAGDAILDEYDFGSVSRVSPEAPVPILKLERKELRPGGAAVELLSFLGLLGA
jgi:bifunctional ADP-heptose synthase (sugar kinase/adenylyltransferase)